MRQIVYFSTASDRQDQDIVSDIVGVSQRHNREQSITGLLVAGGHRYLQVIEGPDEPLRALMARIRADWRHVGVTVLLNRKIPARSFDGWSMAFRPQQSLAEFATFADLVKMMQNEVVDPRLRGQIRSFARDFAIQPIAVNLPWKLAAS